MRNENDLLKVQKIIPFTNNSVFYFSRYMLNTYIRAPFLKLDPKYFNANKHGVTLNDMNVIFIIKLYRLLDLRL